MSTKTKAPTYPCALCGRAGAAAAMTYSRHTGNRFCRDYRACERRKARKRS